MLRLTPLFAGALASVTLVSPSLGQSTQVWLDARPATAPFSVANASHVLPYPGGGVIAATVAAETPSESSPGEAVIRRLSENGDVIWELTRSLETQDYIGLFGREYIAGLDVGRAGTVAVAFGGAGPMDIRLIEPDGSERWRRSIPVVSGPHFEAPFVVVATGGDVVFATNERLYLGSDNGLRFGMYRFAAATGAELWSTGAPSWSFVQMAKDFQGNAVLAVNRRQTDRKIWSLERFDAQGTITAMTTFETDANNGRIADLAVDVTGRTVAFIGDALVGTLVSMDASFSVEWATEIPVSYSAEITLMTDGDAVLTGIGLNWDLLRFERATGVATYSAANVVGRSFFSHAVALPNGNSVVALSKFDLADGLCLQERDPSGAVVDIHSPPTTRPGRIYALALGERGNVHAAYGLGTEFNPDGSGVGKISFEGPQGTAYCGPAVPNSTGGAAEVRAAGSDEVNVNNLSLLFSNLPPGALVLPLASRTTGFVMQAGGSQGNLCLGGSVGRFDEPGEVRVADPQGLASLQVELLRMPTPAGLVPAVAGETWNFQAWFRDSIPGVPSTSNFTDGVSVQF